MIKLIVDNSFIILFIIFLYFLVLVSWQFKIKVIDCHNRDVYIYWMNFNKVFQIFERNLKIKRLFKCQGLCHIVFNLKFKSDIFWTLHREVRMFGKAPQWVILNPLMNFLFFNKSFWEWFNNMAIIIFYNHFYNE